MKWGGFKTSARCRTTPHSVKSTIAMTKRPIKGYARSLESHRVPISDSPSDRTTVSGTYSSIIPVLVAGISPKRDAWEYPHYNHLFKDEGGDEEKGTLVKYIRNDQGSD